MSRSSLLIGGLIVVVALCAVLGAFFIRNTGERKAEREATDFYLVLKALGQGTYTTLEGEPFDFRVYEGKDVLFFFWASWCPSCGEQLQLLSRVAKETDTALPIIAINRMEPLETVLSYLEFYGKPDGLHYVQTSTDALYLSVQSFAMPEFMVYTKDGMIQRRMHGTMTEEELRTLFATLSPGS